jgi:hypothetical protein
VVVQRGDVGGIVLSTTRLSVNLISVKVVVSDSPKGVQVCE